MHKNFSVQVNSSIKTVNTTFMIELDHPIDSNEIEFFIKTGRIDAFDMCKKRLTIIYTNQHGNDVNVHGKHNLVLDYLIEKLQNMFIEFIIKVGKITK